MGALKKVLACAEYLFSLNSAACDGQASLLLRLSAEARLRGLLQVLKPPQQGTVAGLHMVQCFHAAGLPKGLINVTCGKGKRPARSACLRRFLPAAGTFASFQRSLGAHACSQPASPAAPVSAACCCCAGSEIGDYLTTHRAVQCIRRRARPIPGMRAAMLHPLLCRVHRCRGGGPGLRDGSRAGGGKLAEFSCGGCSFTGGDTGLAVSKKAGMVPLQMELGGKDACIVLPDADLKLARTCPPQLLFCAAPFLLSCASHHTQMRAARASCRAKARKPGARCLRCPGHRQSRVS